MVGRGVNVAGSGQGKPREARAAELGVAIPFFCVACVAPRAGEANPHRRAAAELGVAIPFSRSGAARPGLPSPYNTGTCLMQMTYVNL